MNNTEYLRALAYNEDDILEDVIPTDIVPDLRSCKLFTLEDEQIVLHEITDKAKNRKLLDIIKSRPDELYEKFCEILRITNEDVAENLESHDYTRTRRVSNTDFGDILIKGGVPDRNVDYVPRPNLENTILNAIISNKKMPILIHGIIGCGKTSIVSNLLHSDQLFPYRFLTCCWMDVGNIEEKDINNKLLSLLNKLDPSPQLPLNIIPEILVDRIKAKLYDGTTLLILDNIWNNNILHHFNFHNTYIVVSRQSNLVPDSTAKLINIPDGFEIEECRSLMKHYDISEDLFPKIISTSMKNPLSLSMICKLVHSNGDYIRMLNEKSFNSNHLDKIVQGYIKVLDDELKSKYEMLAILEDDETLSLELLSYYWNVSYVKALDMVNKLCDFNLLHKTWNSTFNINLYGVYDIYLKYLQQNVTNLQKFKQIFIDNYEAKYKKWLDVKEPDPFFLIFYGKTLFYNKNDEKLIELYTDFSFIAAKIVICGIIYLQNEYEKYKPSDFNSDWDDFEAFFIKYSHKFMKIPSACKIPTKIGKVFINLIQLALYEPKTSATYKFAMSCKNKCNWKDFWEWTNPRNSIKVWEINHGDNITSFDVMKNLIIMSSDSNSMRLLEFSTGKCLLNFKLRNHILLVKFISDHEFIIIFENGEFWKFDHNLLLNSTNSDDNYDDNEYDEVDQASENDFNILREQFHNLSIDDFISKNFKKSFDNFKLTDLFQVYIFGNTIVFLKSTEEKSTEEKSTEEKSTEEKSAENKTAKSYVAYYDFQGRMKDDFNINLSVKKFVFYPRLNGFYVLKESGEISEHDEFGEPVSSIVIENQFIIDFVLKGDDLFCAARNNIYKNRELILTIENDVYIVKISISDNQTLLALCLTNNSVQVWNYYNQTLLYSLNDSQFTDVYFLHDSDFLLTTGPTSAAKWDLKNISLANNNNNNSELNSNSLSLYQGHFGMQNQSQVSFLLVLQSVNNNIEFFSYTNEILNSKVIKESSEMSCFYFYENIIFIGFKRLESIKVYDLTTYEEITKISDFVDVQEIYAHKTKTKNILEILVHHSRNKIRILHLNQVSLLKVKDSTCELPGNSINCKFFKYEGDIVKFVSICDIQCYLCDVNEVIKPIHTYNLENNVLDVDIDDNCQYLCAISNNGEIKVWEIGTELSCVNEEESLIGNILRKCKFRPKMSPNNWNVVAVINDNAIISLFYFRGIEQKLKILIDPYETVATQIPNFIKWSIDGNYVLVGDYNIRKWKVPPEPLKKDENKLPLTILQTYFGGIQNISLNEKFICTVDQQGFFYILKKID
uniref:Apaf1 n=1 Tax=Schmidtea mediterranea TaxID=79327 RepID=H2DL11_SCHMD|nr:apaf1 [Schmidtea mediterranea]